MYGERKTYGYPVHRDQEIYKVIDSTNKNVGKMGFCIGALGIGGYFLYKKIKNLTVQVEELKKKETGK